MSIDNSTTTTTITTGSDWPLRNITEPHENDVMYGRGGGTNHHPGNKRFRKMVEDRKVEYVNSKRLDKPLVALEIIREWRAQNPPGRFLKLDEKTGLWNDVGDKKAREKTSQALREKAPLIRKQLQEGEKDDEEEEEDEEEDDSSSKTSKDSKEPKKATRFAEGTKDNNVKKAVLARDHSLGREYLDEGEAVTLDGFSWQDPLTTTTAKVSSGSSAETMPRYTSSDGRYPSQSSLGPPPPPPPPAAYAHMHHQHRYDSWGPHPPPPMPGYYPAPPPWRDHSLGQNPLPHASVGHPAPFVFDRSMGSWGPPPPPPPYGPPVYHMSSGGPPPIMPPPAYGQPPHVSTSPTRQIQQQQQQQQGPPSPPYAIDPAVASMWSGKDPAEIAKSWSNGSEHSKGSSWSNDGADRMTSTQQQQQQQYRPDMIKRATSHQNETLETKPDLQGPSVKRAALNRDNSLAANRLKVAQFNAEQEMKQLSRNMDTLNVKPTPLSDQERLSTLDQIAMDLMVRPVSFQESAQRSTTIDALALDLDDGDWLERPGLGGRSRTMEEVFDELKNNVPRPSAITMDNRLTTNDLLDMVNEPIGEDDDVLEDEQSRLEKPLDLSREASLGEWVV